MEITNLLNKDFKVTVTNMLTDWKSTEDLRYGFNKKTEKLKKSHSELKTTVTEMKFTIQGIE